MSAIHNTHHPMLHHCVSEADDLVVQMIAVFCRGLLIVWRFTLQVTLVREAEEVKREKEERDGSMRENTQPSG